DLKVLVVGGNEHPAPVPSDLLEDLERLRRGERPAVDQALLGGDEIPYVPAHVGLADVAGVDPRHGETVIDGHGWHAGPTQRADDGYGAGQFRTEDDRARAHPGTLYRSQAGSPRPSRCAACPGQGARYFRYSPSNGRRHGGA